VKKLLPGEGSKTEAWFILDAAPGSRIYAGLKPGTDARRLRSLLAAGAVQECLHGFEPRPGDCVFLPAGTVHAVGGGVLMAEVQQTSDATFRLFDWDRKDAQGKARPLHVEEALACIDWARGPVEPVRVADFGKPGPARRQDLVRCPFFHLDYVRAAEPFQLGGGRLQVVIVLDGNARLGGETVSRGQVWLLPAGMTGVSCRPEGSVELLISTLPG
jgi:mannose-6-phosphate isomerase